MIFQMIELTESNITFILQKIITVQKIVLLIYHISPNHMTDSIEESSIFQTLENAILKCFLTKHARLSKHQDVRIKLINGKTKVLRYKLCVLKAINLHYNGQAGKP